MALEKHQILLWCHNDRLVYPSCHEQESTTAVESLGVPLLPKLAREFWLVMNIVEDQERAWARKSMDSRRRTRVGVVRNLFFQVEIEDRVRSLFVRRCRSESERCLPDRCHVYAAGPAMRLQSRQQFGIGSKGRHISVEVFLPGWKWVVRPRNMEERKFVINPNKRPTASRRSDRPKHDYQFVVRRITNAGKVQRLTWACGDFLGFVILRQKKVWQAAFFPSFAPLKEASKVWVVKPIATAHVNPRPAKPKRFEQLLKFKVGYHAVVR